MSFIIFLVHDKSRRIVIYIELKAVEYTFTFFMVQCSCINVFGGTGNSTLARI